MAPSVLFGVVVAALTLERLPAAFKAYEPVPPEAGHHPNLRSGGPGWLLRPGFGPLALGYLQNLFLARSELFRAGSEQF